MKRKWKVTIDAPRSESGKGLSTALCLEIWVSICYSSEQLLNIRRVWSTYLTVISRNHLLFGYSRQYTGSNLISLLGNDGRRQIETVVSNRSAQPTQVNYSKSDSVHRSRNPNNLIQLTVDRFNLPNHPPSYFNSVC